MSLESDLARINEELMAKKAKINRTFTNIEKDLEQRANAKKMTLAEYRKFLENEYQKNMPPISLPEPDPIHNNGWWYVGKSVFEK